MTGPKTPKEYFLTKFYAALREFEDTTGVEIHNIKVSRYRVDGIGAMKQTVSYGYDLELK